MINTPHPPVHLGEARANIFYLQMPWDVTCLATEGLPSEVLAALPPAHDQLELRDGYSWATPPGHHTPNRGDRCVVLQGGHGIADTTLLPAKAAHLTSIYRRIQTRQDEAARVAAERRAEQEAAAAKSIAWHAQQRDAAQAHLPHRRIMVLEEAVQRLTLDLEAARQAIDVLVAKVLAPAGLAEEMKRLEQRLDESEETKRLPSPPPSVEAGA